MGDAVTRGSFDDFSIGERMLNNEHPVEKSRRLFIYALYTWYSFTGGRKGQKLKLYRALIRNLRQFDALNRKYNRRAEKLEDEIEDMIFKLKKGDEVMWLRLLMWMGRSNHMFGQFRDISPFAGKHIVHVHLNDSSDHSMGRSDPSLPEICNLCAQGEGDPEIPGQLVLIIPKGVAVSTHLVKRQPWAL